ncbi:hypothetical protein EOPP23_07640 [Endozoicomonas sp. OPT23]|uniref:hypothetical protein n=1 Tax=Endozoicomonas sp. OPT23 TaxID=2072845 RepID=UPI00129A52CA|nr:hypothetical protein [Endozoicomonas sp. OPT23]MRI32856.1 hypothetical protein [Endozoicomonas sp. OPT23]
MRFLLLGYSLLFAMKALAFPLNEPLNPFGCKYDDMTRFYKAELGIQKAKIEFEFKRMKRPETKGYVRQTGEHRYKVSIADGLEPSGRRVTLAHELVHVRQMEEGSIDKKELEKHYLARSFELEAFRLSQIMARKFYMELKCQKVEEQNVLEE